MLSESAFIFYVCFLCEKTLFFVTSLESSVKVKAKYQGHLFHKMPIIWALAFHKHSLFSLASNYNGH